MALNKITFTGKVVELEVATKQKVLDMRLYVHDRSAELEGSEESLKIPSITPGAVVAMPTTDAAFANTDTVNAQITLTLSDDYGKPFIVTDSAQVETNVALMDTYAKNAESAHRDNRNTLLLASIATAANAASYDFKYADTVDNVISEDDILKAAAYLDDAKAPTEGRYMAIRASDHQYLMKISNFISRDKMGQNGETIPSNVIGQIYGFTVIKAPSSNMPYLHTSTGAVDTTGQKCVLFWQQYAVAYGSHIYKLGGPEYKAAIDGEWYNLHAKFGRATQVSTFAVSMREN